MKDTDELEKWLRAGTNSNKRVWDSGRARKENIYRQMDKEGRYEDFARLVDGVDAYPYKPKPVVMKFEL